jgi:hypothetical protein
LRCDVRGVSDRDEYPGADHSPRGSPAVRSVRSRHPIRLTWSG